LIRYATEMVQGFKSHLSIQNTQKEGCEALNPLGEKRNQLLPLPGKFRRTPDESILRAKARIENELLHRLEDNHVRT